MLWLLHDEVQAEMKRAVEARLHLALSDEQRANFAQFASTSALAGVPRNYQVAGDVAEIRVEGVLTPKPDIFAFFFGGGNTTWEAIQQSLALAQADTHVKRVQWLVASPGGRVDGMFETLEAMKAFSKPMSVRASMALSAAYVVAALGGKIESTSAAGYFGAIGVVRQFFVDEALVEVTDRQAPNKRPDPKTAEGKNVIQDELDAIASLTHEEIARGRGTTVRDVVQNFGRGGTVLAGEARRLGMIDKIAKPMLRALPIEGSASRDDSETSINDNNANPTPDPGGKQERKSMNKTELKEKHPEVYASIVAEGRAEGVKEGERNERDRCVAHLTMGQASGDMKTAVDAVSSGEGMTATVQAKYMAANMNRRDQGSRQADSDAAGRALGAAPQSTAAADPQAPAPNQETTTAEGDLGDQVVARLDARRGPRVATK
jgi:ClpP class serine protease